MYNWQRAHWPQFRYNLSGLEEPLLAFADKAGQVSGMLKSLPEGLQTEALLDVMISEALKTSEIEGEYLSRPDVKSSLRNQLGLNTVPEKVNDPASAGAAELMVAVRTTWARPLTREMLLSWHRMLLKNQENLAVGGWRTQGDPMQVVSGPVGRRKVHFEAPPARQVPREMAAFIRWFNASGTEIRQAPVRAALAHLYFESIHPFEDGNGRIGRAVAEKVLSQGLQRPVLLSLSRTIEARKHAYYEALETAQKSAEVTPWVRYFTGVVLEAQTATEKQIDFILRKARFFDACRHHLNERQLKAVRRMLEEGPEGFVGGMNARKYQALTKTSKATATRDLQDLAESGVLVPIGGGRSTRYELKL
jgi:Fic family protein